MSSEPLDVDELPPVSDVSLVPRAPGRRVRLGSAEL